METFFRNARMALKRMVHRPGMTLIAVLSLGLGAAGTTVMFSLVDAVLLNPLPYGHADQLAMVSARFSRQGLEDQRLLPREMVDVCQQGQVFSDCAGILPWFYNLTSTDPPERVTGLRISGQLFSLLEVDLASGRGFSAEEQTTGAPVTILSHALWQRHFQGADVLGEKILLAGLPYTIVGVLPAGYEPFVSSASLWVPLVPTDPQVPQNQRRLLTVGRLAPDLSLTQAQSSLDSLAAALLEQYPDAYGSDSGWGLDLTSVHEYFVGDVRIELLILLAAVLLVLIIACINVANLLLAQASQRGREMAVRTALGAGRRRLLLQLLTESVLLSIFGGGLGVLLAYAMLPILKRLDLVNVPRLDDVTIDGRVLLFTLVAVLVTGVLSGLAPVRQAFRTDLQGSLKTGGGKGSATSGGRNPLRGTLVVFEIAVAVVVLIGAGLMIRSLSRLKAIDPGFDTEKVLTAQFFLSTEVYPRGNHRRVFYRQLMPRLEEISGVDKLGLVTHLPLAPLDLRGVVTIEGQELPDGAAPPVVGFRGVSPDYFATMGIELLRGRQFRATDTEEGAGVVIIDQAMAERFWPGEDPMGKRLKIALGRAPLNDYRSVVGIVRQVRHQGLTIDSDQQLYIPYLQLPFPVVSLVLRTATTPEAAIRQVREAVREVDPAQPVTDIQSTADLIANATARPRFYSLLLSLFGAVSLILTAIGVYGMMAQTTAQRTRETGLRLALGAQRGQILGMVIRQGMTLTAIGLVLGVGLALVVLRLLDQQLGEILFEIRPTDMTTFAIGLVLMAVLALAAVSVPAFRATRVDPNTVLREE